MKKIKIIPYQIKHFELWNNFLAKAKNANFLFDRNFMEYHSDRFKDNSLLIFNQQELIGLLPANRFGDSIYSHQGLTYGALILTKKVRYFEVLTILKSILNHFKKQGIKQFIYKQNPDYQSLNSCQDIEIALISLTAQLESYEIASVIELRNDFEILQQKRQIKKSTDVNLLIKKEDNFTDFWKLLNQNLEEKHQISAVHSLEEIQNLTHKFKESIQLYTVSLGNELLGGTVLFINHYSAVVHVQYTASNSRGRSYRIHDFLFPFLIKKYRQNKTSFDNDFRYFGFGISDVRKTQSINKGLLEWKEKFGARTFAHRTYKIEL